MSFSKSEQSLIRDMVENEGRFPFHAPSWNESLAEGHDPKLPAFQQVYRTKILAHYGVDERRMVAIANEVTIRRLGI